MKKVNQEKVIKKKTDQALTIILAGSILLFSAGFLAITSSLKTSAFIKPKNRPSSPNNLQILHVSPQGSTKAPHEAEKIVVIFDRPMSPLQALPQDENDNKFDRLFSFRPQLKIEPKISGKFRWLGSRTLIFTPDNRFPFGTKVKVTIPASMTALDGSTLGYDYSWEFETIRPVVIHHHPEDEGRFIPLQPEILLIFNQPMDIKKASPFIAWESSQSSGKQKISFRLTHPQAERLKEEEFNLPPEYAFILTLEPGFKLTPETEYRISLKKGLTGKEGPLGLEKDFSFSFKTYNYFRFEGIIEVQEDRKRTEKIAESQSTKIFSPDEAIPFKFSNPVAYNEFVSKVKFDPEIKIPEYYFDWEQTHPLIYLSLPLEPETKYRVTIPSELTDEFGNKLGQDFQITFSTGSFPPSVSMTTGHGLIEASIQPSPRYFLSAINQKSVYVQATRLLPETIIPIVRQSDLFRSDKPYLPYPGFYQIEKEYPLDLRPNQKKLLPLNLVELHPSFRRGFVFLQVDKGGRQDHWDRYLKVLLQITELGLSAKFSVENIIIWVTDLRTGLPVKQAQLEIRDEDNNVRWRGETDENGQVEAPGWKKLGLSRDPRRYGPPRLWVLAQHGENVAFISSDWDYGIDPFRFNIPIDWRPEPARFQGYIFTERGIYRAGEVIHVKGVIREKVRGKWQIPQVLRSLNVEIINPLGQSVFKSLLTLDEFGSFNFDYQSSEESALGFYQIRADIPLTKDQRAQFDGSFRIEAFRPVSFEVHIRSDQESYVFGDEFKATVKANYLFGGAMSGQKMEWSLHFDRTFFSPPGHQGFIFGNLIDWDEEITSDEEESRLIASQEEKLDPEGKG
ncbi:MAG: MG2 domain-containing protein, partial [Candidatus Aminicenantes bacterium]|nr:MG2 domain-containing protein [Candidatus Aminicenantes bacterium]